MLCVEICIFFYFFVLFFTFLFVFEKKSRKIFSTHKIVFMSRTRSSGKVTACIERALEKWKRANEGQDAEHLEDDEASAVLMLLKKSQERLFPAVPMVMGTTAGNPRKFHMCYALERSVAEDELCALVDYVFSKLDLVVKNAAAWTQLTLALALGPRTLGLERDVLDLVVEHSPCGATAKVVAARCDTHTASSAAVRKAHAALRASLMRLCFEGGNRCVLDSLVVKSPAHVLEACLQFIGPPALQALRFLILF